jgi:hypothetical protein
MWECVGQSDTKKDSMRCANEVSNRLLVCYPQGQTPPFERSCDLWEDEA